MNHLVFDLDGTLVDHRGRTYGLHRDYCLAHGHMPVPVETYHERKGRGESERLTVRESIPASELEGYMAWKRSRIELDEAGWDQVIDTNLKSAFVAIWDPMAPRYGQQVYSNTGF